MKAVSDQIDKIFGKAPGKQLGAKEIELVTTEIFKLPKIFSEMLFARIVELKGATMVKVGADPKLTRQVLQKLWEDLDFQRMHPKKRLFTIIAKVGVNYIAPEDFKPMFTWLLEKHPGLEFL